MVIELINRVPVMGRKIDSADSANTRVEVLPAEAKRLIESGDAVAVPWDKPGKTPRNGVPTVVGGLPFGMGR
jgi:hypothetical protein